MTVGHMKPCAQQNNDTKSQDVGRIPIERKRKMQRSQSLRAYHPPAARVDNAAKSEELPHDGFPRGAHFGITPSHLSLLDRLEAQREHDARRRG